MRIDKPRELTAGGFFLRIAIVLAVCFLTSPSRAADAPADLTPFYGQFSGRGLAADAELARAAPLRVRDLDVTIRPTGDGFVVNWISVFVHTDGNVPSHLQRKTATYAFMPGPRAGWYRGTETGDPLEGHPLVWARVGKNELTVTVYTVLEDGHSDLQIYTRRVTGDRMELMFTRSHENVTVTAARGWLARTGD